MTDRGANSRLFEELARELLDRGISVRFQARGASMSPVISDGEYVQVTPVIVSKLRKDDIVLTKSIEGFRMHRLVSADHERDVFVTRGDCGIEDDPILRADQILGIAQTKEVRIGRRSVQANFRGIRGSMLRGAARGQSIMGKVLRKAAASLLRSGRNANTSALLLALLLFFGGAADLRAQVQVDSSSDSNATLAGTGTKTLSFNHTTTTTANRVMIVGVSLNITNNSTTAVSGVTYNNVNLTFINAHNDAAGTRRVEMWYLLAPPTGTHAVVVSVNIPTRVNVGVEAGATTFTGVDQTVPLGTFVSGDGAAGACTGIATGCSSLDVPSVVNGMILDTLAIVGSQTVTIPSPQAQQWNDNSSANTTYGVTGSGSSRTGAPDVPISETFSGTSNWSLGAISINPTSADIAVSTTVGSAVFLGQSTTYTITVTNNGYSTANSVTLSDALASGPTFNSVNTTLGTCTGTGPISCSFGNMASGATATVTVTVTATAAGAYANTATVSDAVGSPPDPNSGNNSYTAVATVQSAACASTAQAIAGGTLNAVVNTYYPGTASVAAGAKSIPIGAATGVGTAIAAGNLLLVIQMQDASINDSNSVLYGNGSTGAGFSALNSAGDFEFVTATNSVTTAGGTLTIAGAGTGGGLVFGYNSAAASNTKGQSTYQVVLVPQYTTATLGSGLTAAAWNGSTGGVLALDSSSTLNLGGATISVDGLGFRGAAGLQLTGGTGSTADYLHAAPATYANAAEAGVDAVKGEGIAGTPFWVESGTTFANGNSSYPSGSAADGSSARGAPGNAGGGATDGDPTNNDQNAGGGGGGNGGSGGFGGDSWNSNLSTGGEGGAAFPATINRIAMGGGGGAGTRNNSDGDKQASSGSAGGGIIIIRAYALSGSATLTANGAAAYNGTSNDAGGGAGAGGSIVVLSANGGESGLTLQANGGRGGDAWDSETYDLADRHGPGGGGGGGVVLVSGAPASVSVNGGTSGTTLTPGVSYGATAGNAGTSVTNATINSTSGTQSGAQCTPDMTLGKSHVGNFTRGSAASYTVPVSNISPYGASSGVVTINDTLPLGLTPVSGSGTGWSCSVSSQTLSCVRGDSLAGQSSYPSITINATVSQSAPSTVTNTATVAGGNEINLANDSATDVANVVSSTDLSVTNVATPNPVAAGSNITYTQVLTNNGPSAADNATFVAAIPANTSFVSFVTPAGWNCMGPGVGATTGNIVCTNANMPASTTANFSMVVKVNTGTANGTVISETATGSSSASDPNNANNSATATTVVGSTTGGELTVTNGASPNPVQAGNNITYTQVVTNTGTAAATTATFTESTPANTTFVSITPPAGWTCTAFPPTCTDASVAAGASGTFTVLYKVAAGTANGTTITDTVTVNAANQAFGANSATATDIVGGATQADLALATVATPSNVLSGNNITYTQTVTNNGPASATTVTFSEATPTNTTFQSVSPPAGWTCTTPIVGTAGTVTCSATSLAAGSSANIVVEVNVPSTVAAGTITATSSVSSTTSDPNSANNSTTVSTTVSPACDLAVTNSGTPSPVTAGNNITYTQTVSNSGPSSCSAVTFSENIPANTTFVSLTPVPAGWTCTTGTTISCTDPSLAAGATASFPVIVKVATGTAAGTIITDTDNVATTTHDTNSANNSASVSIAVSGATQADLSVTNSASPNPVTAGNTITYTQVVTNNGPASATTISLSDPIPTNTTLVSLAGTGWTCTTTGTPTCTIATLSSGATGTITYVVKVNTTATSGSTITQTATVSDASPTDPNSNNNTSAASVGVSDSANLSITNTDTPVPVQAGGNITYTQVVTNGGPSSASAVSVTESTPANTNYQSVTAPAGWICIHPGVGASGAIACTAATLAPGTATITLVVQVNVATAAGTIISDTATVNSSTTDPNSANNSATATDIVAGATQSDLIVTNSATPNPVTAGSNITYTQSVTNNGPAAANTVTFSETTPPNTTFQSMTTPTGWTCTTPAVGGTGTISCTIATLALNASGSFSVVLTSTSSAPPGTNISDTATATATNLVTNANANSSTATVVVANANSADMAIVKTATPNPVLEGDLLTYTLTVTNNGPASATTVTVTDTLPSVVTYLTSTTTAGTCSEAGGTVTCLLGTMTNGSTATITITTSAGTPGVVSNTATVTADQTDPTPANNSSTQTETIVAPTSILLASFSASTMNRNGVPSTLLKWKTGGESHNLGFNLYREQSGERVLLNSSLIAGSALLMSGALPAHAAKSYMWIDPAASQGQYWLEDIDVNGTRTLHGPISTGAATRPASEAPTETEAQSKTFSDFAASKTVVPFQQKSHTLETIAQTSTPTLSQVQEQFVLSGQPAVKIQIKHEGWYSVTQPQLVKAGLDPFVDPVQLHLYAEGIEQAIQISGANDGPGGFGPQAAINFYGTGIDTAYSGTRVYWLAVGNGHGSRIEQLPPTSGSNMPPSDFRANVELRQRTTYFSALPTENGDNFFGAMVSPTPIDQVLFLPHLDSTSTESAQIDLVLQGVILGFPHIVTVALNGTTLGDLNFTGQSQGRFTEEIPQGLLQKGNNTVTLTSENGAYDISLVDFIRIEYPHSFVADSDQLKFTGRPGDEVRISGFKNAPLQLLDITDPDRPMALSAQVTLQNGQYQLAAQIPWATTNPAAPLSHTLLALASDRTASAVTVVRNHPSHWHRTQPGAQIVMVSYDDFAGILTPLVYSHQLRGRSSVVIPVSELYDEFNFGEHSPYAIQSFLQSATGNWRTAPKYLLLNGRASFDPRNYLGFGMLDLVPTKMVSTSSLMTASDDWFSDFNNVGLPTIATGRLPVATADDAKTVISKIANYEDRSTDGSWTGQALLVADLNENENFTEDSQSVEAALPSTLQVQDVFTATVGTTTARQQIVAAINSGELLVNYMGHGSEEQWSGSDIFDNSSAMSLTNGSQLPVFLIMDCLNGFFQDVYDQPLAVTLMLAPNGGSVAVVASSGLNQPAPQTKLDTLIVQSALKAPQPAIGDVVMQAKSQITDESVRKTYVLFGDPAMAMKVPQPSTASH